MNLFSFLENSAEKYPDKTALICEEKRITFLQLKKRSERLASSLLRLGIKKGMKVGILLYNSVEYVEIIFALMKLGAVGVPLNIRLTKEEIAKQAEHADVSILFYEEELKQKAPLDLSSITDFIFIGSGESGKSISYEFLLNAAESHDISEAVIKEDESFIIYTAGTTASPKGVVLTHSSQMANTKNYSAAYNMTRDDIELAPTPLFHCSTLGRIFTYVYNGVTFILCRKFDAETAFKIIEREKVTSITQAPTLYHMMVEAFKKTAFDTTSVKRAVTGAAAMRPEGVKELEGLFPCALLYDLYGATEASPGISILCRSDFTKKAGSVGKPMDSVEIKIDSIDVVGEILCRGPNVMKGYYKDPETTKAAIRDGWFHTGDMGRIDEDGFLYIEGRKKEIIISGGINVYPAEIENIIISCPGVQDVSVIGVPDDKWGEKIVAAIVLTGDEMFSEEAFQKYCKDRLADFKCPREVFIVKVIPRNAAQKVLKNELQVLYLREVKGSECGI
jgi:acyl-CoA synthetase (AMP-forming)/AMP-acid ligase II